VGGDNAGGKVAHLAYEWLVVRNVGTRFVEFRLLSANPPHPDSQVKSRVFFDSVTGKHRWWSYKSNGVAKASEGTYEPKTRRTAAVSSDEDGFSYLQEGQYSDDYWFYSERMTRSHSNWTDPRVVFIESHLLDASHETLEQLATDSSAARLGEEGGANHESQPATSESKQSVDPGASVDKVAP